MPRATAAPVNKRSAIISHILNSRTCHTLKDLEKSLPAAVHGVSPIQVKDHIQALIDDDELRVEKIGAGNWYWRFGAADLSKLQTDMAGLETERDRLVGEALATKEEMELIARERGSDSEDTQERENTLVALATSEKDVVGLQKELASYNDLDPVYLESLQQLLIALKEDTERWTEMIHSMLGWVKLESGVARDQLADMQRNWYGPEWDEEEGGLREL